MDGGQQHGGAVTTLPVGEMTGTGVRRLRRFRGLRFTVQSWEAWPVGRCGSLLLPRTDRFRAPGIGKSVRADTAVRRRSPMLVRLPRALNRSTPRTAKPGPRDCSSWQRVQSPVVAQGAMNPPRPRFLLRVEKTRGPGKAAGPAGVVGRSIAREVLDRGSSRAAAKRVCDPVRVRRPGARPVPGRSGCAGRQCADGSRSRPALDAAARRDGGRSGAARRCWPPTDNLGMHRPVASDCRTGPPSHCRARLLSELRRAGHLTHHRSASYGGRVVSTAATGGRCQ